MSMTLPDSTVPNAETPPSTTWESIPPRLKRAVDSTVIEEEVPILGRGHRKKQDTRPYGGLEAWEEY